jgi:hypothetical protein
MVILKITDLISTLHVNPAKKKVVYAEELYAGDLQSVNVK